MKKTFTLAFALALLGLTSVAQTYNKTYDVTGNGSYLEPSFVITTKYAESITLSMIYDAPGVPRLDYFVITKTDCGGNVIYNNRIFPNNSPINGITNVEALIETNDGGMFIAGYHYDNRRHIEQPMLIKVDANGNLVPGQTHIYYVNQSPIVNSQINKISLCRVADERREAYFIVASGDSDHNPGVDVATNVIKVNANGDMIWSYKYYYNSFVRIQTLREYPGDIDFSPRNGLYMITGYRHSSNRLTSEHSMFFLGIDRDGNPMGYKKVESKSVPRDQDMVYDPNRNEFAVTFTHEKSGYVPSSSSVIGFLRIDCNFTVSDPTFFWHRQGAAHNSRSISLTADVDTYAICSGIYDPDMDIHNPAWLKVYFNGKPTTPFIRYNINDDTYFGHHQLTYNCRSNTEEYVLVNERKTQLRNIRVDGNGMTCGAREYEPIAEGYGINETEYLYYFEGRADYIVYEPYERPLDPLVRSCRRDADSYRPSVATGISQIADDNSSMVMYPSVMSLSDARLIVENNSDAVVKIEMYNITGQLILTNSQVPAGKSEIQLNAGGNLSQGLYLVKVYDDHGSLTTITKLLITK